MGRSKTDKTGKQLILASKVLRTFFPKANPISFFEATV